MTLLVSALGAARWAMVLGDRGRGPIPVAEESVPAWRVSEIGLTVESSGTSVGHRGIFMANYAPWMLRLAYYTGDTFLGDIAKAAVIGRYTNFPGYHINTARTTVYEKPGYPLRPHEEQSYNSFHYNHIWPHMSILLDYLVTDAEARSERNIRFPSQFIEGYAYLQSKFYGHRPGVFYGEEEVVLWMPQRLLTVTDTTELNYVSGRGNDSLYLAFTNQGPDAIQTSILLNSETPGLPSLAGVHQVDVWLNNKPVGSREMVDGRFEIRVAGHGIVAVGIRGLSVEPVFQSLLLRDAGEPWENDYLEGDFGGLRAMVLNLGEGLKTVFIYLQETDDEIEKVTLYHRTTSGGEEKIESGYPFEFTVSLTAGMEEFFFRMEASMRDGTMQSSGSQVLSSH